MTMAPEQTPARLSKEQKMGFFLLLVFGIMAMALGVLKIRNTFLAPFSLSSKIPPLNKDFLNDANALRFRDTDKDSLNDFDEMYVYGTSAYLADTDSDGAPDAKEIAEGTDPNCPQGKECQGGGETEGTMATTTMPGSFEARVREMQEPGLPPPDLAESLQDPVQLRQMLIAAGMQKEILDTVSNDDLMALVAEIMTSSTMVNAMAEQIEAETATGTP